MTTVVSLKKQLFEATEFIQNRAQFKPEIGLILGTGLGPLADEIENPVTIPYTEIPHFPKSTVKFHAGNLILGELCGKSVVVMQGRFHYYEGYKMQHISLPVRVMHQLGINTLLVTNAAGGIRESLPAGTIAIIKDHINLMGDNPLIGPHDDVLGERFPDMSEPYSKQLIELTHNVAKQLNINVVENTYAAISGPCYETSAEIRMLQIIGADSVGMSVIPEVLVARQLNINVLGITVITDQALPDNTPVVTHEEVSKIANKVGPSFRKLVKGVVRDINPVLIERTS